MVHAGRGGFRIQAPGEFAVDGVELGVIQTALEIVVAVGHRPGDAAFHQRRRELGDHAADLLTRALQVGGMALRRTPVGGLLDGGPPVRPPALAEGVGIGRVVPGDLVAGEDRDVGARGVQGGLDQPDRVRGDLGAVLDIGELQHAELAGFMELQASQPRGHGHRAFVGGVGRADARTRGLRGFLTVLLFVHGYRVNHR